MKNNKENLLNLAIINEIIANNNLFIKKENMEDAVFNINTDNGYFDGIYDTINGMSKAMEGNTAALVAIAVLKSSFEEKEKKMESLWNNQSKIVNLRSNIINNIMNDYKKEGVSEVFKAVGMSNKQFLFIHKLEKKKGISSLYKNGSMYFSGKRDELIEFFKSENMTKGLASGKNFENNFKLLKNSDMQMYDLIEINNKLYSIDEHFLIKKFNEAYNEKIKKYEPENFINFEDIEKTIKDNLKKNKKIKNNP